jgi:hypothetical protein
VEFNGGPGFFNVDAVNVIGGLSGASVYYYQQGDVSNPSGDQLSDKSLSVLTNFAVVPDNSFYADLNGHAVAGGLAFTVAGNGGNDSIRVDADHVDIAARAGLRVYVQGKQNPLVGPSGNTYFVMNWSGVKMGTLTVQGDGGTDSNTDFGLTATFLGAPPDFRFPGHGAFGAAPGDLSFSGGTGANDLAMLLHGSFLLHPTGDIYGLRSGLNFCTRTANVKVHGSFLQNTLAP